MIFFPLPMFLFLPFQQSQCFAAGKFTEQLRITYLTDNVSSVVSTKKVLVHNRLKPMQCEIRGQTAPMDRAWQRRCHPSINRSTMHHYVRVYKAKMVFIWQTIFQKHAILTVCITQSIHLEVALFINSKTFQKSLFNQGE